jgi:heat shock protein HslJ
MKNIIFGFGLSIAIIALSACAAAQPGSGGDLIGKVWSLSELAGKSLVTGSGITAQFSSDGKVSGSAGCNRYSGSYTVSGNTITFPAPLASTMMMCDTAVMDQETAYLNALSQAQTYSVKTDQLTFFDSAGSTLGVYNAQSQELSGSSWEVISYNNGKQAVTSVMIGTSLTASFGTDGKVSGNSGCNSYSGTYKLNANEVAIGPLASTKKFCGDPSGVMDQESQYLAALQSAASYQVEGNVLELRTQDGALAVQFNKR